MNAPLSERCESILATTSDQDQPTETVRDVFELLLERKLVEALSERELPVHLLLRDVEVLHIEEPILSDGLNESLG